MPRRRRTKQAEWQQGATGSALVYNVAAKIDEISAPGFSRARETRCPDFERALFVFGSIEKKKINKVTGVRISRKNKSATISIRKREEEMARGKRSGKHLFVLRIGTRLHTNIENLPSIGESDTRDVRYNCM